jgi:hypothetical protein
MLKILNSHVNLLLSIINLKCLMWLEISFLMQCYLYWN